MTIVTEKARSVFQDEDGTILSIFDGTVEHKDSFLYYSGRNINGDIKILVHAELKPSEHRELETAILAHTTSSDILSLFHLSDKCSMTVKEVISLIKENGLKPGFVVVGGKFITSFPEDKYLDELPLEDGVVKYDNLSEVVININNPTRSHIQATITKLASMVLMKMVMR